MNLTKTGILSIATLILMGLAGAARAELFHAQGEMAGEVDENSVILQSRLTATQGLVDGDVPGAAGAGRFEISVHESFRSPIRTDFLEARADTDFILKTKVTGLKPATTYFYRLQFGANADALKNGPVRTFRTLQGRDGDDEVSFVVVTGMNYPSFHYGRPKKGVRNGDNAYTGPDKELGYPALAAMKELKPDFFIGTGDNVYYDSHDDEEATDITGMRRKWHEQLVQPRFADLFTSTAVYWEKDDHDHRYNDCDREGDRPPLSDLGIRIFREQVPVADPTDPDAKTYRTFRLNRHLQIWLVEGRDYRSPNKMPDGPDKTLWGAEQIAWLKRTLSESDASWKLLISPTPMVGPDDAYKIDNHTNHKGFRTEGRAFFDWIKQEKLDEQGFAVICGDRHWQYHSINPTGIEEFSCGAICDANSRGGRKPGDPKSTDPNAEIKQPHRQKEASGGFLRVVVTKAGEARFEFYDETGELLSDREGAIVREARRVENARERSSIGSKHIVGDRGQATVPLYGILTVKDLKPFVNEATVIGERKGDILIADVIQVLPVGDQAAHDDPKLPRHLFIGDSISGNYGNGLRTALEGKFNLHHPPTTCGPSGKGAKEIVSWLGACDQPGRQWDVISFNHGHWDAKSDKATYQTNLEKVITELKKTGAEPVWVTTCPVPNGYEPAGPPDDEGRTPGRLAGVMEKYLNPWAAEVMKRHPEITICDQWQFVKDDEGGICTGWWAGQNVHFGGAPADALGKFLAECVLKETGG